MAPTLTPEVYQDDIAIAMARAMSVANKRASQLGVDVADSLITVSQQPTGERCLWRVNYGPRDCIGRRGGDVIIEVDPDDARVTQVLRGQ